jgi:hypothetical protein
VNPDPNTPDPEKSLPGSVIEMTSPKPKAPPEPPVSDDPEQFQRFVEAARELGIEEVGLP